MPKIKDAGIKIVKWVVEQTAKNLMVTIIGATGIAGTIATALIQIFTRVDPLGHAKQFIRMWYSGWIVLLVICVVASVWHLILWRKSKNKLRQNDPIPKSPSYFAQHNPRFVEREHGGVIWKVMPGTNTNPNKHALRGLDVFAWVQPNPYCPVCGCELERQSTRWYCTYCDTGRNVPKKLRNETRKKINRIFQTFVVQWGHNNFGIAETSQKSIDAFIREREKNKA